MGDRSQIAEFRLHHSLEEIAALNARFREQQRDVNLSYYCIDCAHLVEESGLCSLAFPNADVWAAAAEGRVLTDEGDLGFCKYFEVD